MSLVNDALKRAQDAQRKSQPAAPGPQFRPAEPAKRSMGIWVPVVIAIIAVVGLVLALENRHKAEARQSVVESKPAAPVVAAVTETKPLVQPMATPAPAPATPVVVAEKPSAAPVPAPVASAPAPTLKLQAIFYAPGHSQAIINGKTVRVGDNFKGFRVAAMTQTSATLVSATQTNVMTLEQD